MARGRAIRRPTRTRCQPGYPFYDGRMQPDQKLIDEIYRQKLRAARAMSPEDKLLAGPRLFERSLRIMADGIRSEYPDANEDRVQEILQERLALLRRLRGRQ